MFVKKNINLQGVIKVIKAGDWCMKLGNILNDERVSALKNDSNAYVRAFKSKSKDTVNTQSAEKVIFPEPYENAGHYYNKNQFNPPPPPDPPCNHEQRHHNQGANNGGGGLFNSSMMDMKSLLPMLMSGKFNDVLKPLMTMFGGSGGASGGFDIAKIFELFKPKSKPKKDEKKEEEVSSKFDDFIIIED